MVIDRAKDVAALTDGTKFAPQFIENKLKFGPYIKEAVAFGQNRPYVAAMINIDMENVGKWAERNQVAYTTYTDLSQKPQVYELIARRWSASTAIWKMPCASNATSCSIKNSMRMMRR